MARRVVILGGGFGGAYAAKTLQKARQLASGEDVEVVLIDRNNYLTFYPLLVEAAVGVVEPRHVVVPIRSFMKKGGFRMGEILGVDLYANQVSYLPTGQDEPRNLSFDHLVLGFGAVSRVMPVPGLQEHGFFMKSLAEGIELRDRGIQLMEMASDLPIGEARKAALTFIVVGANFTGVEFAGEFHAFLLHLRKSYPGVEAKEIRVLLLEFGDRILNQMPDGLATWVANDFEKRGIELIYHASIKEMGEDYAILTNGDRIPTSTVVWTAGVAPSPLLEKIPGIPRNEKGYVPAGRDLRVEGLANVWAVGDIATVLDAEGKPYAGTAQNAIRQGPVVAKNILAALSGQKTSPFEYKPIGAFAVIGNYRAAAEFKGMQFKGVLGWFMFRSAYLLKMPTLAIKARLAMDWLLELLLKSPTVQLGLHRPKR